MSGYYFEPRGMLALASGAYGMRVEQPPQSGALFVVRRAPRAEASFREEDHPRSDDGKFGSGSRKPKEKESSEHVVSAAAAVKEKVATLPKTNVDLGSSHVDDDVEAERQRQIARIERELSSIERGVLDEFVGGKFQDMRKAEIDGHPPDAAKKAKILSRGIERFERKSQPVTCFRGLHVAPDVAEKLMTRDTFDGLATSFWSASPSLAAQFSAGMNTADREKNVPIVLVGKLRGLSVNPETGYDCEVMCRAKQLAITKREHYQHPKFGRIAVLHVQEAA